MSVQLKNARAELLKAGAVGVPAFGEIKNAVDGKTWTGAMKDGSKWELTKNKDTSYNTKFGQQ